MYSNFYNTGYFDPHGRTRSPQHWSVLDTYLGHPDMFSALSPTPNSIVEESFDSVLMNPTPLQVHTVVVQQGDQVDLVQSFFNSTEATQLANKIAAYAADEIKVSVKTSELSN